jgi:hypothetical protein
MACVGHPARGGSILSGVPNREILPTLFERWRKTLPPSNGDTAGFALEGGAMKIKTACCVATLMVATSWAAAQTSSPSPSILCSPPAKGPLTNWAQYQFDPCHTGYNPYEFILNTSNVGKLVVNWTDYIGGVGSLPVTAHRGQRRRIRRDSNHGHRAECSVRI